MDQKLAESWAAGMVKAGVDSVVRVVFYGSRARGAPRSHTSDWDFIVVLNHPVADRELEELRFTRAALDPPSPGVRLDVWVMGLDEWETACELCGHPARSADVEGIVLYAR